MRSVELRGYFRAKLRGVLLEVMKRERQLVGPGAEGLVSASKIDNY
jgi:hypothetical protein